MGAEHHLLQIVRVLHIPASSNVVLGSAHLEDASTDVGIRHLHRLHHLGERDAQGGEAVGIEIDLVLLHEPADARDFCDARHRLQRVSDIPVLQGLKLLQGRVTCLIDERILEDPTDTGRVRTEDRRHALRQLVRDGGQLLQHAAARPVHVGAVFENHVHERHTEHGLSADGRDARRSEHRADDGIGDVVLDQVGRATHPFRKNDHLHVREVRDGVEGRVAQGQDAPCGRKPDEQERRQTVLRAPGDDPPDHGAPQRGSALRSCASLESRKVAWVATSSPSRRPASTS